MRNMSGIATPVLLALTMLIVPEVKVAGQESRPTTINWRVTLDSTRDFDFGSLRVRIFITTDEVTYAQSVISVNPDREGRFSATVPTGRRVTLAVESSDPTVRRSAASEDKLDYYTVGRGKWETVKRVEFVVPPDTPTQVERTIELRRGAAFALGVPPQLRSGAVYFRKPSWPGKDRTNVIWFYEGSSIHRDVVGGLEPGRWLVTYYDGDDRKLKTRVVDLSVGEIRPGDQ